MSGDYSMGDVETAIDEIRTLLKVRENKQLQVEFEAGLHPDILSYEKVQPSGSKLPILDKYMIGAASYLHTPCNYYDIFRVCRCVNMVQFISRAISVLKDKKASGLEVRLERLKREVLHDPFDAVAFELITAARYAQNPLVSSVEFIKETNKKTPDLRVVVNGNELFVECKKIDRSQNHSVVIRDGVRELLASIIKDFRNEGVPLSAEVTFNSDPRIVNRGELTDAVHAAFDSRTVIIHRLFTVKASSMRPFAAAAPWLYPSPGFYWQRYGFRIRSEWFGIVNEWAGTPARLADVPDVLKGGRSSWFYDLDWDAGIKWKIADEDVVAKCKRFAFDGVFKGLNQIQDRGENSSVHLWLETDYYVGNRKTPLLDLFNRLATKKKDLFGWLMVNETLFDVSPKGYFDVIEHAHMIRGPKAIGPHPIVSGVFAPEYEDGIAGFGEGHNLPDIDEMRGNVK